MLFALGCFGRSEIDADMPTLAAHGSGGAGAAAGAHSGGGSGGRGGSGARGGASGGVVGAGSFVGAGGVVGTGAFMGAGGAVGTGAFVGAGGAVGTGAFMGAGGFVTSGGSGGLGTGGFAGSGGFIGGGGVVGAGGSAGACGAMTCAGCCSAAGLCLPGTGTNACGLDGARCTDCGSSGFGCDKGICQGTAPSCAATCAGCCDSLGRCRLGSEIDACGVKGQTCSVCSSVGAACTSGKCVGAPPKCDAKSCGGCCDGAGTCRPGSANGACGTAGAACQDCTASGRTCSEPGSYCGFIPSCTAVTCPGGCCDAKGVCHDGRTDAACGTSGQACSDCTSSGQQCAPQGFCYSGPHCGPDTCAGCCAADGTCRPGSNAQNCGNYGELCQNCNSQGLSCQTGSCATRGAVCPAAAPGCNPGAATSPPSFGTGCGASDLAFLAKACSGAPGANACNAGVLNQFALMRPACFDCVQQFLYEGAVAKCLAPFLNQNCNHELTCFTSCTAQVCGKCPAADRTSCQNTAAAPSGACGEDISGAFCAQAAYGGPGTFCDPSRYSDIGAWLQGVGAYYCSGE
jgi:hypothetical protein